jgi:hypothetical protein
MVARHGWKAVFGAVVAATGICLDLRFSAADPHLWQRWEDRLDRLDRLIPSTDAYSRSRFLAVIYPEVVGLATVIACPAWRKLATDGDPGRLQRFLAAAARCVGTSGWWAGDPTHPVVGWAHASGPPAEPATTFPEVGSLYHRPRGGLVDLECVAEQQTARRFASDRRAPYTYRTPLPYGHRHPRTTRHGGHSDPQSPPARHLGRLAAALPVQPPARR